MAVSFSPSSSYIPTLNSVSSPAFPSHCSLLALYSSETLAVPSQACPIYSYHCGFSCCLLIQFSAKWIPRSRIWGERWQTTLKDFSTSFYRSEVDGSLMGMIFPICLLALTKYALLKNCASRRLRVRYRLGRLWIQYPWIRGEVGWKQF